MSSADFEAYYNTNKDTIDKAVAALLAKLKDETFLKDLDGLAPNWIADFEYVGLDVGLLRKFWVYNLEKKGELKTDKEQAIFTAKAIILFAQRGTKIGKMKKTASANMMEVLNKLTTLGVTESVGQSKKYAITLGRLSLLFCEITTYIFHKMWFRKPTETVPSTVPGVFWTPALAGILPKKPENGVKAIFCALLGVQIRIGKVYEKAGITAADRLKMWQATKDSLKAGLEAKSRPSDKICIGLLGKYGLMTDDDGTLAPIVKDVFLAVCADALLAYQVGTDIKNHPDYDAFSALQFC